MRSASSERKRAWGAPLPKQAIKLTVPSITPSDLSLSSLHTRLAALANKVTEFVSASLDALAGSRTTSTPQQERLLEELKQEKEKWEHHVFYALTLEEDALQHSGLETATCDLGSAVGDFKRVSQLVADAQNQVTLAMRRAARRDDSGLNSRLWQVFTGLNQSIYEAFFRRRRTDGPEDPRVRQLEGRLAECQDALRAKDSEVQNMERRLARDRELFTKVEYAAQLESDLRSAEDLTRKLRADLAARDLALKDLERRVRSSEGSPRFKAKGEPRFTDKRPSSALREPAVNWKELETELQREREKSRSFFNALKRKEKECDELYESLGTKALDEVDGLKREKEELTKALSEARRTEQRQTNEISQLATLVKSLEREKTRLESEKSHILEEKDPTLQFQMDEQTQANEDLRKQLKLVLEDKQKLLRILSQTKAELSRTADGYTRIERERDLLEQKGQALVQEKDILLRQLSKTDLRKAESLVTQVQTRIDIQLKSISERLLQREKRLEEVESQCKEGLRHYDDMLREANDRTGEELERAEARVQAKEAEIENLTNLLSQVQGEIRHLETQYSDFEQKSKDLAASLRLQNKEKEATIQQLQYEREILESEDAALKQELSFLKDEMHSLQSAQVQNSREAASSLDKMHLLDHSHKAEIADSQRKVDIQMELNRKLRQENSDLQWHLDQAETSNKALEGQMAQSRSEDAGLVEVTALLKETQSQLTAKQRQLEEAQHMLKSREADIEELERDLKTLREEKTEMELQLDDAFARLQDNEQFRNQAEERLCQLQEDHRKGLAELSATQKQLRDLQGKKTESDVGVYSESVQVGSSVDARMREIIAKSIEALQAQEGKLKQELAALEMQLGAVSIENTRLKGDNSVLQDQTRANSQTIVSLKEELAETHKQHNSSFKRIRVELTEEIQTKEAEIANLREEMQIQRGKAEEEVKELVTKSLAALQGQEAQLQIHLKETNAAFLELSAQNEQNIRKIEDLRITKTELEEKIASLEADLDDKSRQIHTSETASNQKVKELLSKSLSALQGQEAKLREEITILESKLETFAAENKQLIRENGNLHAQISASEAAVKAGKEELEEGRKQHSLSTKRIKTQYMAEIEAKDAEIASLKAEAQATDREKRELMTKSLSALQGQKAQLDQEIAGLNERNSVLMHERDSATSEKDHFQLLNQKLQMDLETLQTAHSREMQAKQEETITLVAKSIEALQGQEAKLKAEITGLEKRLSAVSAESKKLRGEMGGLQDQARASACTIDALREELVEAHKQHNASLKRIRTEFTSEVEAKAGEIATLKEAIRSIAENKERERMELISKSIEALQGQETSFKQQISSLSTQLEASMHKPVFVLEHTNDTSIVSLEPALDSPSSQLSALHDAYSSLEAEHSSLQQQYIDLKDTCEKQKNQVQHLTALLKQAKETSHKLKGSSDSSREHRRFEDLNAHLAELNSQKEELEGALVAALRERERRKGELAGVVEVLGKAGEDFREMVDRKWGLMEGKLQTLEARIGAIGLINCRRQREVCIPSPAKRPLSSGIAPLLRYSPSDLTQTLQLTEEFIAEHMQRLPKRLEEVDGRASSLLAKSLLFTKDLLTSREQTRSLIQAEFTKTGLEIGKQVEIIEGKFAFINTRASGLMSKQSALISFFAEHREKVAATLKEKAASFCATLNAVAEKVETRLGEVDKRTSALIGRQIGGLAGMVERGKQAKSRENASIQGLFKELEGLNAMMGYTSESLEKRLEAIDAKASSLLSKALAYISTLVGAKTNFTLSAIQPEIANSHIALEKVSTVVKAALEAVDSKASALIAKSLRSIAALTSKKAATEAVIRNLLLAFSVPSLDTAVNRVNTLETRLKALCIKATTQITNLKSENSRLISLLATQNRENQQKITILREETEIRFSQIQAESDFKLQRVRKAQISQELDTFALVDMREETLARTESAFRLVEKRVLEAESRLRAVQRAWTKGKQGWKEGFSRKILGNVATLAEKLSVSVDFRMQNIEKRLLEAGNKLQNCKTPQKPAPNLSSPFPKPALSHEPIKISLHLDDSLEFTPLEPSHRRGSSVNTSLDDMKQALGNMRICRKVVFDGQVWVLTATLMEEPEYYWWREQDLPGADLVQGETVEEEMQKELEGVKLANLEALGELQRAKSDLETVNSWLSRQGYDLKRLSLEAALAEATRPSFRPLLSPISADGSVEVTFIHEGESSQTPKMGKDAIIIPAPLDSELDGLLETIQQQEVEKMHLMQQNDAQSEALQAVQGEIARAVSTLQDSQVLPHDVKGAEVLRQLLTLLARPVWKPN